MKIYYENTLEDLADCNVYNIENSSAFKAFNKIYTLAFLIIFSIMIILVYRIKDLLPTNILIIGLVLIGLLCFLTNPKRYKKRMRKLLIESERNELNGFITVDLTLTLNEEGVSRESKTTQYKVPWSNVENVKVIENYIYIYIRYTDSLGCFAVPIKTFKDSSEKDTFLQIFKQYKIDVICV